MPGGPFFKKDCKDPGFMMARCFATELFVGQCLTLNSGVLDGKRGSGKIADEAHGQ